MEKFFIKLITLSLWKKYILALGTGCLSALAFPGFYIVGLLWICLPFALLLQDSLEKRKQSFWLGFFFGAGMFLCSMLWLYHPLTLMDGRFLWLIPFALIGVAVWGGVFIGFVFYGTAFFKGKFLKILAFSFLWAVFEYLRSNFIFGGIAWNTIATVWAKNIEFAQIASIVGGYSLTFITIFAASLPFGLNKKYLSSSVIILLLMFIYGQNRIDSTPTQFSDKTFKIIQPNISQEEKHSPLKRAEILRLMMNMSQDKVKTDYVIWPETSFPYVWQDMGDKILNLDFDGNLIAGVLRIKGNKDDFDVYNSAILLQDRKVNFVYDKMHLVPFGEYIPFAKYIPMQKIVPGQKDISAGVKREYLHIPEVGNVAMSICYEIIFSGELKGDKSKNVDLMINLTNDKWFGDTQAPYQHMANAVIRAIEEGVPVVRAANSGISAVIDPVGRVISQTKIEEQAILTGKFPLKTNSFYNRYENQTTFLFFFLIFSIILFLKLRIKFLTYIQ